MARISLSLLYLFLLALPLRAENLYVTPSGAGARNGSNWDNAFAGTGGIGWGGGTNKVGAGDTLWFAGGNYGSFSIGASGTSSSKLYIKRARSTNSECTSAAGWQPGFDSTVTFTARYTNVVDTNANSYLVVDGQMPGGIVVKMTPSLIPIDTTDPSTTNIFPNAAGIYGRGSYNVWQYIRLEGPAIAGPYKGFVLSNWPTWESNNTVSHLQFVGWVDHMFVDLQRDSIIEYSEFDRTYGENYYHDNVMYINWVSGLTIRYNVLHDMISEGIYIATFGAHTDNVYIYGNVFHDAFPRTSGRALEIFPYGSGGRAGPNIFFYNNVLVNLGIYIRTSNDPTYFLGAQIKNNVFWHPGGFSPGSFFSGYGDHNWYNMNSGGAAEIAGGVNTDPFVDRENDDYRIKDTISATMPRNKGVNLGAPYNIDAAGTTRGSDGLWDIGAYEVGGPVVPRLTVSKSGSGTVTGSANNASIINCGSDCEEQFAASSSTLVTLTAAPASGSAFVDLSGCSPVPGNPNQCTVTVSGSVSVQARFSQVIAGTIPFFFEAEAGILSTPMASVSDANASGGQFIQASSHESGTASFTLNIPSQGTYYLWGRTIAANDGSDSLYVYVDQVPSTMDDGKIWDTTANRLYNQWQWSRVTCRREYGNINNPVSDNSNPCDFSLSPGVHTFIFHGREQGTRLDQIYVTNSLTDAPPGAGSTPSAPGDLRISP